MILSEVKQQITMKISILLKPHSSTNFMTIISSVAKICGSILQYKEGYSWIIDTLNKLHANIISIHWLVWLTGFLAKTKNKIEVKKERFHSENTILGKTRQTK